MELNNKLAVVTGVSKGIGKALVDQLLERGANVAGWGRKIPAVSNENFQFFETNVRDYESVTSAYQKTVQTFNQKPDILINNAGLGYFGYIEDITLEQWHQLYETNVNGIFYACKNALPAMKEKQQGHVINISSVAGIYTNPQNSAYCGTKFAVRGISESLFKELREFGIKVTTVYPGSVKTDFFENAPGVEAHDYMMTPEEVATQIVRAIETTDNFLMSEMVFRPLQPKGPK